MPFQGRGPSLYLHLHPSSSFPVLTTKDEKCFCRVGVFVFKPLQEDDVRDMRNYAAIASRAGIILDMQQRAFRGVAPRTITIV